MPAFIFDIDGTLAETEELHRQSFNRAFAEAGLGWAWDRTLYADLLKVTGGKERIAHYVERTGLALDRPVAEVAAEMHKAKTLAYVAGVRAILLRPGVADLIAEARERGIRLAVATTTTRANVDGLLAATLGSGHGFEAIACGDMVPAKKPAPDIYLLALEMLGLPADQCLAFEDSANGVRSAKAAGLRVVVTPALYTAGEDFTGADLILPDLTDRASVFGMIGA
ncbi:HAD-IA family hydrolase [Marinivivus vitaminiproducens]|uniref:HAD-IA family hydrolase n=1 Tax=Marinivivus vitaminiproducens TaxID=3035935 RepID=UPI0027A91185|nr:HAD-IA family hydrolase [Geminicoccaceae bacterium SCSIO 64248]